MNFDIFLSICQNEVDGFIPSEKQMFENFFSQVKLADRLGFKTAWVAETHLSCQVQKRNPFAVIPDFKGEIGLNTDILQLSHLVYAQTQQIKMGSAIRNILCNGGPIAHAEALKTFATLHSMQASADRKFEWGFASGRFPFSNIPFGIRPRSKTESVAWKALTGRIFLQATEIFMRLIKGEEIASKDVTPIALKPEHFRSEEDWQKALDVYKAEGGSGGKEIPIPSFWQFDEVGVIPFDAPLELINFTIGAHWREAHELANKYHPCGVFNLSITPPEVIEATHNYMKEVYNPAGGAWNRSLMPRTVLVFVSNDPKLSIEENNKKAREMATKANQSYMTAIQGTIDPVRIAMAVDNALAGHPETILQQVKERFHPEDRLMLWFDFNNHNGTEVEEAMKVFMEQVAPNL
ncbi:MAG: LLM class flavin-dependent oxidoreductase [Bdellovibrionales bacterium]|nr:LLM class flavin-dependent oxidoreductase [Bdellovibrionales bacterium]